jgi:hypothetical protein
MTIDAARTAHPPLNELQSRALGTWHAWQDVLLERAYAPHAGVRFQSIDLARGTAVTLMILSHGVVGLVPFAQFPSWGQVPIHLFTKFASTTFVLVFGIALAVAYLPHVGSPDWPRRRRKLLLRGVIVLFWYKVLTIVEMSHLYEPADILNALAYRQFPVYVEILGFYGLALLWVPFVLPLWVRSPLALRLAIPVAMTVAYYLLSRHFHFWHSEPLRAILVEHPDHYTWGQLARGPLVFAGLLMGEFLLRNFRRNGNHAAPAALMAAGAVLAFALFVALSPQVSEQLMSVARNQGKHPPELLFMLFSTGGALMILSVALLGGDRLARALRPVTLIGTDALKAFVFHIFVIFVFFRYLLDYWHNISYSYALTLTVALILATALWIKTTTWVKAQT